MPQQLSTNTFTSSTWIVNSDATKGTHTTLASALTSATSGDTILLQTSVTENVTLKAGVNITGYAGADLTPNVSITGKLSLALVGVVTISNIDLITNSDNFLAVTGSAVSVVNLRNCYLNCLNNTGISYTTSNAASQINLYNCQGNLGTTGIGFHSMSSTGLIQYFGCTFTNSGASTTASSNSAGVVNIFSCYWNCPLSTTSIGVVTIDNTNLLNGQNNAISVTTAGSGTSSIQNSQISSGTASAISIGTGTTLNACLVSIMSSNTNAITGAGTLNSDGIFYIGTSHTTNVTTQTGGAAWGLTQGTAPSAGCIGEQIRSNNSSGTAMSSSGTATAVANIVLTPGVWDISCALDLQSSGLSTAGQAGISTSSTSFTGTDGDSFLASAFTGTGWYAGYSIPAYRVTISASTTYYLVASCTYSTGGAIGFGRISGTRVG